MLGRRVGCVPAARTPLPLFQPACVPVARTLHTKQTGGLRGVMGYLKNGNTGFQVAFAGYVGFVRYTRFGIATTACVPYTPYTPATGKAT